jgi:hypothetical protein
MRFFKKNNVKLVAKYAGLLTGILLKLILVTGMLSAGAGEFIYGGF